MPNMSLSSLLGVRQPQPSPEDFAMAGLRAGHEDPWSGDPNAALKLASLQDQRESELKDNYNRNVAVDPGSPLTRMMGMNLSDLQKDIHTNPFTGDAEQAKAKEAADYNNSAPRRAAEQQYAMELEQVKHPDASSVFGPATLGPVPGTPQPVQQSGAHAFSNLLGMRPTGGGGSAPGAATNSLGADIPTKLELRPELQAKFDEVMKGVDPRMRQGVAARVQYAQKPMQGRAAIHPLNIQERRLTQMIDPSYDENQFDARHTFLNDWASSKGQGGNITALNTVMGHLTNYAQRAKDLGNTNMPIVNRAENAIQRLFMPTPKLEQLGTSTGAVTAELATAFKKVATDEEIQMWAQRLGDASRAPADYEAAVSDLAQLLQSRLDSVGGSYTRTMGRPYGQDLLQPDARQKFNKLLGMSKPQQQRPTTGQRPAITNITR